MIEIFSGPRRRLERKARGRCLRRLPDPWADLSNGLDLGIIGSDSGFNDHYAEETRLECAFVPDAVYRPARTGILPGCNERRVFKTQASQHHEDKRMPNPDAKSVVSKARSRGPWAIPGDVSKSCAAILLGVWLLNAAAIAAPPVAAGAAGPNACNLLSNDDLEPVLFDGVGGTLDSWSGYPAAGMSTCRWEARLRTASPSTPPRVVTLAFYHLADRKTAQAQLAGAVSVGGADPSLAIDGQGDDEVLRSSAAVVSARHGVDIARLDAGGAELSSPGQTETRYLLDSLALKAAGATVKPPPWAKPGQAAGAPPLSDSSSANWTPAANPQALSSPFGQWALLPLIFILRHQFLVIFGGIFGSIAVSIFLQSLRRSVAPPKGPRFATIFVPVGIVALILEMFFGNSWADRLLYRYGTAAAATITDRYGTSVQYNNHNVVGYHVLIRTPRGDTVSTGFEDDDFNVYPPHNATTYPGESDIFTVRYLPILPSEFVIVSDDGSPWGRARRCAEMQRRHDAAISLAKFSRNPADLAAATNADAADCG